MLQNLVYSENDKWYFQIVALISGPSGAIAREKLFRRECPSMDEAKKIGDEAKRVTLEKWLAACDKEIVTRYED